MDAVDAGIEMGLHLYYGDLGHNHFVEPKDMRKLVDFANALIPKASRPVNWLHMPVSKSRKDTDYFSPLEDLKLGGAELYLGLLHVDDEAGTRERIRAGRKFISNFGIATECGFGRSLEKDLESALKIAKTIIMDQSARAQ